MVPLLLTALACNSTAQWAPSHAPITDDLSPSSTAAQPAAACSALLADILDTVSHDSFNNGTAPFDHGLQDVGYLVVYGLDGEELGEREDLIVPAGLDQDLDSRTSHEYIWSYFKTLIPAQNRSFVTEFAILSDGRNGILAGVSPTYNDPGKWTLKVDVADSGDPYSLTYSLMHEYGHLLTLNASQVPPDHRVFFNPDDKSIRDQAVADCPRYFTGEGCSNPGSYIDEFYNRFWSSSHAEAQSPIHTEGQDVQWDLMDDFYHDHADRFLTGYAATSPDEDIAESWAYFVLSPRPEPASIASQKILFFYDYPELVALRQEILKRLCTSLPGS